MAKRKQRSNANRPYYAYPFEPASSKAIAKKRIKDLYGNNYEEFMKEQNKKMTELAENIGKYSVAKAKKNNDPSILLKEQFYKTVKQDMERLGLVTPELQKNILANMEKTEIFQELVNANISDAELIQQLKDGLGANKAIVVNKELEFIPDHKVRREYLNDILELKGYKKKEEEKQIPQINIAMLNPDNVKIDYEE